MINLRTLTISMMLVLMLCQSLVFGVSDALSLLLLLMTAVLMFNATLKLQIGNKKALRANAKENSFLYAFLSKEKTISILIVSIFSSLTLSTVLVVILKGIVINHGVVALFILVGVISFAIFSLINKESIASSVVDNNFQPDVAKHANELMYVVIVAVSLNVVLSLLLSAHDTMTLLNSNITFANFDQYAVEDSIEKNGSNYYTRIMTNLYIVLDYFKLAVTIKILDILLPGMQDRVDWFYLFYLIVFLLNMMKLFAFSLSFVLLQKGMETGMRKPFVWVNKKMAKLEEKFRKDKQEIAGEINETKS